MGYVGEDLRRITRALNAFDGMDGYGKALESLPPCTVDPVHWDNGYTEKFERGIVDRWIEGSEQAKRWMLYRRWHISKEIGCFRCEQLLEELKNDPKRRISGYLADSIVSWRKGERGYEGCSGMEYACWIKQHPELWDQLMPRAPVGAKGDNWEQVFPHERERAAALRAKGYTECLRMNDSIWARKEDLDPKFATVG